MATTMLIDMWIRCPRSDVDFYKSKSVCDCFARSGARLVEAGVEVVAPDKTSCQIYDGVKLFIAIDDMDPVAEIERLVRDWLRLEKQVEVASKKLNNPAFISRAPSNIVQTTRDRLENLETQQMFIKLDLDKVRSLC